MAVGAASVSLPLDSIKIAGNCRARYGSSSSDFACTSVGSVSISDASPWTPAQDSKWSSQGEPPAPWPAALAASLQQKLAELIELQNEGELGGQRPFPGVGGAAPPAPPPGRVATAEEPRIAWASPPGPPPGLEGLALGNEAPLPAFCPPPPPPEATYDQTVPSNARERRKARREQMRRQQAPPTSRPPMPHPAEPLLLANFVPQQEPRPVVISTGTVGHPHDCGKACPYMKKPGGCRNHMKCHFCHLCCQASELQVVTQKIAFAPPAALLSVPPVDDGIPSVGSIGHPHTCNNACKYHSRGKGCKDGRNCVRCHICIWRRSGAMVDTQRKR